MTNSLYNKNDYDHIVSRINNLSADSQNNWGKMTAGEMVCHLTDPFRDVMKIRDTKPVIPAFLRPIAKKVILSQKPFKINSPTLKMYKQGKGGNGTKPTTFDNDKQALLDILSGFAAVDSTYQFGPHGGLGKLSREENGYLMWKHIDHHLRSFGL
ncbi:MAG: DUF1569 domain-containing protein [Ignavibacteria bacterium]|nr:DUF1569 domain-containing protein [Ignavibacteria bacterium]